MTEVRAMWVTRLDITNPDACRRVVSVAKEYDFNTLIVQVRGRGDAFYKSSYDPRSQLLDSQNDDFDPLGLILKEGHNAGIQIHAWLNANLTWDSATPPVSPDHIVNKHPDWLMRTKSGIITMTPDDRVEGAYACPSNEDFRQYLQNVHLDVIQKYDVDGVHNDFIRYPSENYCYCDRCMAKYRANCYTDLDLSSWNNFRREQINELLYAIYDAVKTVKPAITVSAAVFPDYTNAYTHRFQDWKRWIQDGKIDMLFPMTYSQDTDIFAEDIGNAIALNDGIPICAGIGSWRISPESTIEKIEKARELGAAGFCLFSYSITEGGKNTDYLRAIKDQSPPLK